MIQFWVERVIGIPEANETDLEAINKLNGTELKQGRKMTWREYTNFLHNTNIIFVVARKTNTGEIIGKQTIYLTPLDCGTLKAQLEQVATDSRYKRMGIGRAIWNESIRIARELGVELLYWTSGDEKGAAQKFYDAIPGCERRETNNFRFKL